MSSLQLLRRTLQLIPRKCIISTAYSTNVYEPDYLDALKPKIPLHEPLNIEIRGYDYPLLESYQRLIHTIATNMDINVEDSWASPHQDFSISTYKPNSEIVESQYHLKTYRRTVQITDCPSTQLPILLRAIEACVPIGVKVNLVQHTEQDEEDRYIPDKELLELKDTLESMGGARKK
ncbi:large ribosomal subunit protein mL48 [Onthophagus taurus]|uniref:large ribosomal subunit protein mL48 n=1 Tax=Onthophagus taurus TaxID=166361 RepID=UPI0039BE6D4B